MHYFVVYFEIAKSFISDNNISFYYHPICLISLIKLSMKVIKLSKVKEDTKIHHSIKTEATNELTQVKSMNRIILPSMETEVCESIGQSYVFKNNKTNIKQLYDFLKNQLIVVKQKQRLFTNQRELARFRSISEMDSKIAKAICLKSQEEKEKKQSNKSRLKTICLPKLNNESSQINLHPLTRCRKKEVSHRLPHNLSRRVHNIDAQKRLKSLGNRSSIQDTPLLYSASKNLERQRSLQKLSKNSAETSAFCDQVINLSLFNQKPRLSKLSIKLVTEVSRASRNSISQQR